MHLIFKFAAGGRAEIITIRVQHTVVDRWFISGVGGARTRSLHNIMEEFVMCCLQGSLMILWGLVLGSHVRVEYWHSHCHGVRGGMDERCEFLLKNLCRPLPKG